MSPTAAAGVPVESLALTANQRRIVHMAASVLLDYPAPQRRQQYAVVAESITELPGQLRADFETFLDATSAFDQHQLETHFTSIFDMKRKCCPYLTYYSTGDTRKRGMALVSFLEAYRAAGWEIEEGELPDYLPAVLEFSARSDSRIAGELLASHREGIEVLRAALASFNSVYTHVVAAVCRSLPTIDDETRRRYLQLLNEGPPTELVGVTFLGALAPFSPSGAASEGARV